jgi:glycogen debranching enzyme
LGCRRYGFAAQSNLIARDVSAAASYFVQHQMPELYAGLQRDPTNFPVQYLGANVPQAWAAGSCFSLLHAMIGFQPDAPDDMLYLDPDLPDWMPDLFLQNLRVGSRAFDVQFTRTGEGTTFEVARGDKRRVAHRSMAVFEGDPAALSPVGGVG